jgi:hypothetical protein
VLSAIWGAIVAWDWHTYGPIVTALAVGLTTLTTIVYTVGTLLLWGTTRRSVRAMENAVKLTFLQMLYETKRPSKEPVTLIDPATMLHDRIVRQHYQQMRVALQKTFPELYTLVDSEEQAAAPEARQDRP